MTSRNRRRGRQANMKARVGIAAAVLVGGGAAGVAVAASHNGVATTAADPDAYVLNFHHSVSERTALTQALNTWNRNESRSLSTLAQMASLRTFSQFSFHHETFAAQRGVVVAATKQFIIVKSANGKLELWWLNGWTKQKNVTTNATGLVALTGVNTAAHTAVTTGNMAPASTAVAGSTAAVNQATAPVTKPITITVNTGTVTITITITGTTATVTPTPTATSTATVKPTPTATATPTATSTATATPTATATKTATATATPTTVATMPVTTAAKTVARGDLVLVTGVKEHGKLVAELILFAVPKTTVAPTVTTTVPPTTTATAPATTPTAPAATSTAQFSGVKS